MARPERMTQHRRFRRRRFVVALLKYASENRTRTEHVEEAIGYGRGPDLFRRPFARQRGRLRVPDGNGVSGLILVAPGEKVRVGQRINLPAWTDDANFGEEIGRASCRERV